MDKGMSEMVEQMQDLEIPTFRISMVHSAAANVGPSLATYAAAAAKVLPVFSIISKGLHGWSAKVVCIMVPAPLALTYLCICSS